MWPEVLNRTGEPLYKRKGLGLSATFIFKDSFAESEFLGKKILKSLLLFFFRKRTIKSRGKTANKQKNLWLSQQVGFSGGSEAKESSCNVGDLGSMPGLGRSPGGEQDNPLKYSCLENPHGQKSWTGCSSRGVKESDTTEPVSIHTS